MWHGRVMDCSTGAWVTQSESRRGQQRNGKDSPGLLKSDKVILGSSCSSKRHQCCVNGVVLGCWAYTCSGSGFLPPLLPLPGIVHPHYPPAGQDFLPSAERSHKNSVLWACLITRGLKIKASCSGTEALSKAKVTIMAGEVLVHSLSSSESPALWFKIALN